MTLENKKLLVLGGKPIGSCEIVEYAKQHGIYTIVADYLPKEQSAAKQLADETWDISTGEVDTLVELVKASGVNGVYTGVHEFNIAKMIEICQKADLPCYCSLEQWNNLVDKRSFKRLCRQYGIPVAKEYHVQTSDDIDCEQIDYPVIIKPADGSGSRGFSICANDADLKAALPVAAQASDTGHVLVEQMMDYKNSVIINYTIFNGEVVFSGISDKHSKKVFEDGAPVMSVQFYPSLYQQDYLNTLDEKAKAMFKGMGLKNGVLWIEAFCKYGHFTFNEAGYRFGGSLTYYPVERIYGVQQLGTQIEYALTGAYSGTLIEDRHYDKVYTIMPVHVKPGKIVSIDGLEELESKPEWLHYVPVHFVGDEIQNWGSAQQVLAYIHYETDTREESAEFADSILKTLSVKGENGEELLFNLYR